jgi:hypothetical protein
MPWPIAILVTLGLFIVGMQGPIEVMILMLLGTAAWAAYDSKGIGLQRYKSGISLSPPALFAGIVLMWIVAFPWYLIVRGQIKAGSATLKNPSGTEAGST